MKLYLLHSTDPVYVQQINTGEVVYVCLSASLILKLLNGFWLRYWWSTLKL